MQIGDQLFVTSFWDGSLMLRPKKDKVEVVWKKAGSPPKKTQALHSLMSPPVYHDGHLYGICAAGQFRCINSANGDTLWETMAATTGGDLIANTTAFLTPAGEHTLIANDNGELIIAKLHPKAYEELARARILEPTQKDGKRKVLWSHPAYSNQAMFWRNDKELVRVDLSKKD
jgi:outer membrane protein assembly factor BamB